MLFCGEINQIFTDIPMLRLNLKWPSVGFLDYLLSPLRNKEHFSEEELEAIDGACSYLAILTARVWSSFPKVGIVKCWKRDNQIIIELRGGMVLKRKGFLRVNITDLILSTLKLENDKVQVFPEFSFTPLEGDSIISPVVYSLFAGTSAYKESSLKENSSADYFLHTMIAEELLASGSSNYYKDHFSKTSIASKIEFYSEKLISSLMYQKDIFPAFRAAMNLSTYLREQKLPHSEIREISENLMLFPDSLISSVGFCIAAALSEGLPSKIFIAKEESFPSATIRFRHTIICLRKIFSYPENWLQLFSEEKFEQAKTLMRCEANLGLCPFLWLDQDALLGEELDSLRIALAWSSQEIIVHSLKELVDSEQRNDILAYKSLFFSLSGLTAEADAVFSLLKKRLSDSPSPSPNYLELAAEAALEAANGHSDQARDALYQLTDISQTPRKLVIDLAKFLILKNNLFKEEQKIELCERVLEKQDYSSDLLLITYDLYLSLGKKDKASATLNKLLPYITINKRIVLRYLATQST